MCRGIPSYPVRRTVEHLIVGTAGSGPVLWFLGAVRSWNDLHFVAVRVLTALTKNSCRQVIDTHSDKFVTGYEWSNRMSDQLKWWTVE